MAQILLTAGALYLIMGKVYDIRKSIKYKSPNFQNAMGMDPATRFLYDPEEEGQTQYYPGGEITKNLMPEVVGNVNTIWLRTPEDQYIDWTQENNRADLPLLENPSCIQWEEENSILDMNNQDGYKIYPQPNLYKGYQSISS